MISQAWHNPDFLSHFIVNCHVTDYNSPMIKTFADKETQQVFVQGKSKNIPPDLIRMAVRRLEYINLATNINDWGCRQAIDYIVLKVNEKGNIQFQ